MMLVRSQSLSVGLEQSQMDKHVNPNDHCNVRHALKKSGGHRSVQQGTKSDPKPP